MNWSPAAAIASSGYGVLVIENGAGTQDGIHDSGTDKGPAQTPAVAKFRLPSTLIPLDPLLLSMVTFETYS